MSRLLCVLQVQGMALNKGLNLNSAEEEKEAGQCGITHECASRGSSDRVLVGGYESCLPLMDG